MNIPKVSVIVPVYNVEKYLQQCIDSLLEQTYPNIELIFVDDGSCDNSYDILCSAAKSDSRISVIYQENAGPSAARNNGLRHCTGKYIMFCDSDDIAAPEWCAVMVNAIEKNPLSWIVCGFTFIMEGPDKSDEIICPKQEMCMDVREYYSIFLQGLSGSVYNKIFSADIINDHNIIFDEAVRRGEDAKFNLDYLRFCNSIKTVPYTLYHHYRYSSISTLTNVYNTDDFYVHATLYRLRYPYIAEKYSANFRLEYWRVLNNELERTMHAQVKDSFSLRINRNSKAIRSDVYQFLLNEFDRSEMHPLAFLSLVHGNYFIYWLIQECHQFKHHLSWRKK